MIGSVAPVRVFRNLDGQGRAMLRSVRAASAALLLMAAGTGDPGPDATLAKKSGVR